MVSSEGFMRLRAGAGDRAESERRAKAAAEAEAKLANESEGSISFHSLVAVKEGAAVDRPVRIFVASTASLPKVVTDCLPL